MKKVSKAILIGLAVLAALMVALIVSLNLYVQSPGSQARIQEELSKALRLPLKLTNISVSPFSALSITGITIPNGGANFLEAASFNARYRLFPLLRGKLIITEMSVENPKILWTQSADGKWKLPEPEQAANEAKEAAKSEENKPKSEEVKPSTGKESKFAVIVERFNVKGGTIELFDQENKHVAVCSDVNMTYSSLTAERVEGSATIGKLVWADTLVFENLRTPFKYTDEAFSLPEIEAAFAGGTVQGKFQTHTEKAKSPLKIALTFNKLDLDKLAVQTGAPAGQTVGWLGGQMELHADAQQKGRMEGEGRLDLRDAQFHQLDLFQNIGQILGLRELSDLRVKDGHSDLRLVGDKILVNTLTLNTADLQLSAHGNARLDKHLNLTAQLSVEDAVAQHLPGMIRDSFTAIEGGRHAIDFTVTGTADKPKTNLLDKFIGQKVNTQFDNLLNLLGGDKKAGDEKPKKEDKKSKKKDKAASENISPSLPATTIQPSPTAPNP